MTYKEIPDITIKMIINARIIKTGTKSKIAKEYVFANAKNQAE